MLSFCIEAPVSRHGEGLHKQELCFIRVVEVAFQEAARVFVCLHVHPLLGRLRRRRPSSTSHTLFESEVAFTFPKCIAVALKLWLQASSALRQDGMLRFVPTSLDMKTGTRTLCACCFMFHLVELVTPQHDACFLMLACAMVVNSPSWHFTCSPRHRALPGSGLQPQ